MAGSTIFSKTTIVKNSSNVSKIKHNREYLLSKHVASELNTYLSFSPFVVFNDLYEPKYKEQGKDWVKDPDATTGPSSLGVRSIFNKAGAVMLGSSNKDIDITKSSGEWRISNNVPLMDSPKTRQRIRQNSGCSVKELVQASQLGLLGRSTYDYSDFMYCKHLGKVSNNYLITLRRFPLPVDDFISTIGEKGRVSDVGQTNNPQSIGCLVTWMGTPGNEMNDILKYTVSMPFEEQTAQWEDASVDADSGGGIFNGIASVFDSTYRKQYMSGQAGTTFNSYIGKYFGTGDIVPYSARDINNFEDRNKVYGPVDVIKKTYMRSKEGLNFGQSFTLTFDYELRSYNGINGRQAMLDLISNILNVVYTTGTFWGGGYKGGGAHQNSIFSNLSIFKTSGGATQFVDDLFADFSSVGKTLKSKLGDNPIQTVKNFLNDLGGMFLAGQLNKLGRPQKQMVNSLLSPAPIGFWHVTIGNPHHPIMSLGNMILKNTTIEHYGPLGLDDFPTGIKVTCELERGKPRDIRDIEKMYMHGNDRIFYSMGPKVFDMYKNAKEYKDNKKSAIANNNIEISTSDEHNIQVCDSMKSTLKKYFGHDDTYSIYVAAAEQEYGAHKKPSSQEGPSSGDSRAKGTGGHSGATQYLG